MKREYLLDGDFFDVNYFAFISFIQQALYLTNELAPYYAYVTVHIWLSRGNHYLIQCDELVDFSEVQNKNKNALCSLGAMQKFMPITDNVIYEFKALGCDDIFLKESWGDDQLFESLCSYVTYPTQEPVENAKFQSSNQTIVIPDKVEEVKEPAQKASESKDDDVEEEQEESPSEPEYLYHPDSRPVIHINDPSFFFNITG